MDLNDLIDNSSGSGKKKMLMIILICSVLVIFTVICLTFFMGKPEEVSDPIVEVDPMAEIPKETIEPEKEVKQEEVVTLLKARVVGVTDLSTIFRYEVSVGNGDNVTLTTVEANTQTEFINLETKKSMLPSEIVDGDTIILYSTGNYNVGDLSAKLIGVGDDTSYRFATIVDIESDEERNYTYSLSNTTDKLYVPKGCSVYSFHSGDQIRDMVLLHEGNNILYKYLPEFEITENGNIYTCYDMIAFDK